MARPQQNKSCTHQRDNDTSKQLLFLAAHVLWKQLLQIREFGQLGRPTYPLANTIHRLAPILTQALSDLARLLLGTLFGVKEKFHKLS